MSDPQRKESDTVGITSLDAQHQGLFATLHRLSDAMRTWRAVSIQQEIIAELLVYSRAHCEREERVMATAGFPGTALHLQSHRTFLEQIQEVQTGMHADAGGIALDQVDRLCAWLRDHVAVYDAQYAAWIQRREYRPVVHEMRNESKTEESLQCHS